jgi:diacylglycerol O-acyltransferase / wax synthase
MDTMSALDASFLYIENELNHMHVGVIAIFDGPVPQGEEIEDTIASKLDRVPRYRQKVRFVPLDLGRPVWSDEHHFDIRYHVRHTAIPRPGSDDQLRTLVGRVMSQPLDRSKPLWEIWVVDALEGDRWAMISKTHHCMVDGVSGSDLLSVLLDHDPVAEHPRGRDWNPEPVPSSRSLLTTSMIEAIRRPREGLATLGKTLGTPVRLLRELADFADGLSTFRSLAKDELESSLNGPIGPDRRWANASTTIPDVLKIRSVHGGTVNDIVLSAIAQGFRALLSSRGEPLKGLFVRTLVPVSIRREEERGTLNNRISAMFADLPMEIEDPLERLAAIRTEMEDLKEHHMSATAVTLSSLTDFTPPVLLALGARIFAGLEQHAVQTVTTNVPGPRETLYAAGCRMLSAYPYVPLGGSVRIGVAIFSYTDQLTFGITGDYRSTRDIDVLAGGIQEGIDDLLALS